MLHSFDLLVTVVYPIVTLAYCYFTFAFDRAVMTMYLEKLPPSSFEHLARTFADPSEIALFRLNFDSLRAQSVLELMLRVGMNLSFCYKFWRIGNEVVASQLEKKNTPTCTTTSSRKLQKRVPKGISLLFFAFSVSVWVFTFQAIQSSRQTTSLVICPGCFQFTLGCTRNLRNRHRS